MGHHMGWNFRKSIRIGKGFRINLNKKSISVSTSIPGTGLSYTQRLVGNGQGTRAGAAANGQQSSQQVATSSPVGRSVGIGSYFIAFVMVLGLLIVVPLLCTGLFLSNKNAKFSEPAVQGQNSAATYPDSTTKPTAYASAKSVPVQKRPALSHNDSQSSKSVVARPPAADQHQSLTEPVSKHQDASAAVREPNSDHGRTDNYIKTTQGVLPKAVAGRADHPVSQATESKAAARLRLAKQFLAQGKNSSAKRWLNDVVDDYPGTEAARESTEILKGLLP